MRPRSLTPVNYHEEAEELRALADATRAPRAPRLDGHKGVPQHLLVPAQGDPDMWAVRVKVRHICTPFTSSNAS